MRLVRTTQLRRVVHFCMHSSTMKQFILFFASLIVLSPSVSSHSLLGEPQPTASKACKLGGVPSVGGIGTCPGPCDVRTVGNNFPNLTSPRRPAARYFRGQKVTLKYHRNNHGPGGFVRVTLVPPEKMMNKLAHERNAFHYSCWGANPVPATQEELERDRMSRKGFTLTGGDGRLHDLPVSYYTTNITIPACVPDGRYVLGWAWYGGVGGSIYQNKPQSPYPFGLFSDYWSCAFVTVRGGKSLEKSCTPQFQNDMARWWPEGCNAANNALGSCVFEPCVVPTRIQKPRPFANGNTPNQITPMNFRIRLPPPDPRTGRVRRVIPTPVPPELLLERSLIKIHSCKTKSMQQCLET